MSQGDIHDLEREALGQTFTTQTVTVSLSIVTAKSAQLPVGRYRIVSDAAVFIQQGGSSITATTGDALLPANVIDYMYVTGSSDDYLAGILAADTGTLYITKQ